MPRPGVDIYMMDDPIQGEANLDPSQGFYAGFTSRGRMGKVTSFTQYKNKYGDRTATSMDMYDAARAFFEESGGATLYVSPMVGPTAVEAEGDLGDFLHVTARGAGTWGNDLTVKSLAPASLSEVAMGGVVYQILENDEQVERSPAYATVEEAIEWSLRASNYVIFEPSTVAVPSDVPVAGATVDLAGGVVDDAWSNVALAAALDQFPYNLGPGQVYAPGHNEEGDTQAIADHTVANWRVGITDLVDSGDPNDIAAQLGAIYEMEGARNILAVGPSLRYSAEVPPATIWVPPGGTMAGIIARVDKNNNPSMSAAGVDGYSARGLAQKQLYTDDDRAELNNLGASLFKDVNGQMRMYGYRTAAGPGETNWLFYQESRVIMMIAHELNAVLEEYVLKTMDGKKRMLARVNIACSEVLARYWADNALYGESSSDAFRVDTFGPNTAETMKNGELHANILLKTSKLAEWIKINLIKYRTERQFAAAA